MEEREHKSRSKIFASVILIICAGFIVFMTIRFVRHRIAYAVTDAVFVRTDSLTSVGFDGVSGKILTINKKNGDQVRKGEILAKLDDTSYRFAVQRIDARFKAGERELMAKQISLQRMKKQIVLDKKIAILHVKELKKQKQALNASVNAIQVEIEQLERDNRRYQRLLTGKAVSHSKAEYISTRLRAKKLERKAVLEKEDAVGAAMATALRRVELAELGKLRIKEIEKEVEALKEKIKGLAVSLENAKNNLSKCILRSPLSGRVAKRFVSPGALVSPRKVVFSLLNPKDIYIIALLEEQKLAGVVPGAAVNITIDAYPDFVYKGKVEKIMPASAATFALAPRDISAGEFTKVSQRIPVRIIITKGDITRLKVGMGGEVEIKRK